MKKIMLLALGLTLGLEGQSRYGPNDGANSPGTFSSRVGSADASTTTSPSGLRNSSGVTTDQMNTSPNQVPLTDEEVLESTTLSTAETQGTSPFSNGPSEIEAQEEDALDYSTAPDRSTVPQEEVGD